VLNGYFACGSILWFGNGSAFQYYLPFCQTQFSPCVVLSKKWLYFLRLKVQTFGGKCGVDLVSSFHQFNMLTCCA
jgi:hypothetical protein